MGTFYRPLTIHFHFIAFQLRMAISFYKIRASENIFGKPDIDLDNEEARQQLLQNLVADSRILLESVNSMEHTKEEQLAAELLATITEQDIEINPEGKVTLRNGVAKDRVISVEDPDGRKTSRGKFNGNKRHIMIDEASEIKETGEITFFVFHKVQCDSCPFRNRCLGKGNRRTVSVHPQEQERREIIEQTKTEEFQNLLL